MHHHVVASLLALCVATTASLVAPEANASPPTLEALDQRAGERVLVSSQGEVFHTRSAAQPADIAPETPAVLVLDVDDHLSEVERGTLLRSIGAGDAQLNSVHARDEGIFVLGGTMAELSTIVEGASQTQLFENIEFESIYETYGRSTHRETIEANDPLYAFQWNFDDIGVEGAWADADGEGVIVAVIDTGVSFADAPDQGFPHIRDLSGTGFVGGYDFVSNDTSPFDEHGHGTHVAGTIAQTTGNSYGVAGIAPRAKIMPIRVLDAQGRGTTTDIADAIRFAADHGAHVINLSLGGPLPSRVLTDAINYAHRKGVTIIAAAGNSGSSMPSFPAANRHVIGVSATQFDRTTTFYSNYGRYVDIAAPGGNTRVDQNGDGRPDGILQETIALNQPSTHEFAAYMGTSMAAPHVAGVAALIRSRGVTRADQVERILLESATQDVPSYTSERYGAGLLDANSAVARVRTLHGLPAALILLVSALSLVVGRRTLTNQGAGSAERTGALSVGLLLATSLVTLIGLDLVALSVSGAATLPLLSGYRVVSTEVFGSVGAHAAIWSALLAAPLLMSASRVREAFRYPLLGGALAFGALLIVNGLVPVADVVGVAGVGFLDSAWLVANGVFVVAGVLVASLAD